MNCFEFRHRKMAHPRQLGAQARTHAKICAACAVYGQQQDALEEELERALRIPVPDGLADRILLGVQMEHSRSPTVLRSTIGRVRALGLSLAQRLAAPSAPRIRVRHAVAIALVLVIATASLYQHTTRETDLARAVIGHVVDEEPDELRMHADVDPSAVPRILAASGVRLPGDVTVVRYLGRCGPPGRTGEHFVLQTPFGKATLVLMPAQRLLFRVVSADAGLIAVAAPAPVGSLAVVTDSERTAGRIADDLRASSS